MSATNGSSISIKSQNEQVVSLVSKVFIAMGFINFIVGATLGGIMANSPQLWGEVGPLHGELNPYGWLTLLIYGMTYAVLKVSAGLRPPYGWLVWLHVATAELGVIIIVSGYMAQTGGLVLAGYILQAIAPLLFLANVLTAVATARRARRRAGGSHEAAPVPAAIAFLGRSPLFQATDRVGQRGTDVSLLIFVTMTITIAIQAIQQAVAPAATQMGLAYFVPSTGATLLVYYGWLAGTVFFVWLHLFPRFLGRSLPWPQFAVVGQAMWGAAIVLLIIAWLWVPTLMSLGDRVLGCMFIWWSVAYLWMLREGRRRTNVDMAHRIPAQSLWAWYACWSFALVLGICLLWGVDPLSVAALHLLFLGFITSMIYGVGYRLFPLFLRRRQPNFTYSMAQILFAVIGVLLMVTSFLWMYFNPASWQVSDSGTVILAIGGTLAMLGAILFLIQWPFLRL